MASPFGRASEGDVILFKRSGGPIVALASVLRVQYEQLTPTRGVFELVHDFGDGLGYEPGYAESKTEARFASLLWLDDVRSTCAVGLAKRDRHAWITFEPSGPARSNGSHGHAQLF